LRNGKHVFENWGYERQDALVNVEVTGPCRADDHIQSGSESNLM
jgi:D-arabinose 1-dehydrogenase-like Zn-dependent alcohol dehydrogenase